MPPTFQLLLDAIIEETKIEGIFRYQDDKIVGAKLFSETVDKRLFQILEKYNLPPAPRKCSFHKFEINCLSFHIANGAIETISSPIIKITSFPVPKNKHKLKKFIGVCDFYRHLIPTYTKLTYSLVKLTIPKVDINWLTLDFFLFN